MFTKNEIIESALRPSVTKHDLGTALKSAFDHDPKLVLILEIYRM